MILALLCPAAPAWAISLVVDVNPLISGIQSSRTVLLGDPVTVDVVVVGDGLVSSLFEIITFAPTFDSSILALAGMTGMPTAGTTDPTLISLVGPPVGPPFPLGLTTDAKSLLGGPPGFLSPGTSLGTGGPPGGVAYRDSDSPDPDIFFSGPIDLDLEVVAASITFDTIMDDTSPVEVGLVPSFLSAFLLKGGGTVIVMPEPTIVPGFITVTAGGGPVIPEPSTILLLGTGLVGLAAWRLKKR